MLTASSLGYIFPGGVSLLRVGQSRFDRGNEFIQPVKRSSRCFRRSSLTFRPLDAFLTFFKTSMITKTLGKKIYGPVPAGGLGPFSLTPSTPQQPSRARAIKGREIAREREDPGPGPSAAAETSLAGRGKPSTDVARQQSRAVSLQKGTNQPATRMSLNRSQRSCRSTKYGTQAKT